MRPLRIVAACSLLVGTLFGGDAPIPPRSFPLGPVSPYLLPPAPPPDKPYGLENLGAVLLRKAKSQFDRGDYVGAEKSYRAVLQEDLTNLYALSSLGVVLFRMSKWNEAEDAFKQAIKTAPQDGFSHRTLGIVYYTEAKYDDAAIELTKALAIDPKNAIAHNYLGITASKKGGDEVAQKELEAAIALDADYGDALFNLAVVFATKTPPDKLNGRRYYARALKLGVQRDRSLENLIEWPGKTGDPANAQVPSPVEAAQPARPLNPATSPPAAEASTTYPPGVAPELVPSAKEGKVQFNRGNYLEAEKIYRGMLAKEPQNIYLLSNLGVVLFRAGKLQLSEETFRKAIGVAPEDGFSHCTLGIVYYSEGKYDEAVNELTKALTINPQNATAYNYLGISASQKGWNQAAQLAFERARKLDPSLDDQGVPKGGRPAQ